MLKLLIMLSVMLVPELHAAGSEKMYFDIYVPTERTDGRLQFNHYAQVGLVDWDEVVKLFGDDAQVGGKRELYVYLPKYEDLVAQKAAIAAAIRAGIEQRAPGSKLRVVLRFRGEKNSTWSDQPLALNEKVDHQNIEDTYQRLIAATDVTTKQAKVVKNSMAGLRLLAIAGTRYAQVGQALSSGGAPMLAAGALIFGEAVLEGYTISQVREIQEKFARLSRKVLGRVFGEASRDIGVPVLNLAAFSVGWPLTMQTIAHVADPSVPLPNLASASSVVLSMTFDTALYVSIFTRGYEELRAKGWLTNSQIDILLQLMGTMYFVNGMINSNPNWYHLRYFTWIPVWSIYLAVGAAGKLAPARSNRLVLIESSLKDLDDVWDEQFIRLDENVKTRASTEACDKILASSTVDAPAVAR